MILPVHNPLFLLTAGFFNLKRFKGLTRVTNVFVLAFNGSMEYTTTVTPQSLSLGNSHDYAGLDYSRAVVVTFPNK